MKYDKRSQERITVLFLAILDRKNLGRRDTVRAAHGHAVGTPAQPAGRGRQRATRRDRHPDTQAPMPCSSTLPFDVAAAPARKARMAELVTVGHVRGHRGVAGAGSYRRTEPGPLRLPQWPWFGRGCGAYRVEGACSGFIVYRLGWVSGVRCVDVGWLVGCVVVGAIGVARCVRSCSCRRCGPAPHRSGSCRVPVRAGSAPT
jgi:hypothetical protein